MRGSLVAPQERGSISAVNGGGAGPRRRATASTSAIRAAAAAKSPRHTSAVRRARTSIDRQLVKRAGRTAEPDLPQDQ